MRYIAESTEDEMVWTFLSAEIASRRFGVSVLSALRGLGLPEDIIYSPDLRDARQNAARKAVLRAHRGYGADVDVFRNSPSISRWTRVALCAEDLGRLRYINYSYWIELSGGTRLPLDAAANIRQGVEAFSVPNTGPLELSRLLESGAVFPPLILVSDEEEEYMVVLEGHARLTAYAMRPERMDSARALVGYCSKEDMHRWDGAE